MIAVTSHAASCGLHARSPKLTPQLQQLAERTDDDARIPTRRLAHLAREVMHADFLHPGPTLSCPREDLDVNERTGAAKLRQQRIQQVATVYLEAAIHVAYRDPE